MDYNKLRTFVTVARVKSISQAARLLFRTQSAITQQMRALESDLELVLYERKGKAIHLTPEGESVLALAEEHLARIDDGVLRLKGAHQLVEGVIRVGLQKDYATEYPFGERLSAFQKQFTRTKLEVSYGTSQSLEEDLTNNRLDIAFLVIFKSPHFFERHPVATAEHILVGSREYLRAHGPLITVGDLLRAELLDFTPDCHCLRAWVKKNHPRALSALRKARPSLVVPNHLEMTEMVLAGLGVAVIPRYLAHKELDSGRIVRLFPRGKSLTAGLDIAVRRKRTPKLHQEKFLEFIRGFPVVVS